MVDYVDLGRVVKYARIIATYLTKSIFLLLINSNVTIPNISPSKKRLWVRNL